MTGDVPGEYEIELCLSPKENRKHTVTLITETIYQKTLIPWIGMLLFPFRLVSFELFYILFQGLELRDFRHLFSFAGSRFAGKK